MAFEDVYSEVLSTSVVAGTYDEANDSYLKVLVSLLPQGPAWVFDVASDMLGLLEGMSYSFFRVFKRGQDLLEEFDPRTTVELIDDWERVFDLPGDNPSPPTTLAERQAALHAAWLGHGDTTPAAVEDIAAGLGYTATVEHKTHDPFVAGSPVGDPLTQNEWAFVWYLKTLGATADATLKYLVGKVVPLHTRVVFKIVAATWVSRTSQLGSDPVRVIGWAHDLHIVAGDSGKLSTSPDGETWTARTIGFGTSSVRQFLYADALLMVIGDDGNLSTSVDGITWSSRTSQFGATDIKAVVHAGFLFTAVGSSGKISTSPDGETWTARTAAGGFVGIFNDVLFGRSLYLACGASGELQTSPDGSTWTARNSQLGSSFLNSLAYGNGTLVVVGTGGGLSSSTDGITWVSRTSQFGSSTIKKVIWGGSLFVAVGDLGKISTSPDGETWTAQTANLGTFGIVDVIYYNGLFVCAAQTSLVAVSEDGETWTTRDTTAPFTNFAVHGAANLLLSGGSSFLATTPYGEL